LRLLSGFLFFLPILGQTQSGYLGSQVCAGCHKSIANTQAQTAMAQTWQSPASLHLSLGSEESYDEGPDPAIHYALRKSADKLSFEVDMPGNAPLSIPIETIMGGKRHGLSFLARMSEIDGFHLMRAPLIETRYLHYAPENRLELSPGFPKEKPTSYDTALGRVLTPHFEEKCLSCHGAPRAHGEIGVGCESCHGPGQHHLAAVAAKAPDKAILNPAKLPEAEQMKPCSECHAGFSKVVDPMPDDLLISDQVTALSNSDCWRQSAGRITCVNCHNPHQDAPRAALITRSEKTCLGCHSAAAGEHAALCPVNRQSGCVGCHMPESTRSAPFVISDHWIRVHPEQNVVVPPHSPEWRSKVVPKHLFLRLIVLDDAAKASSIREQIAAGASFFDIARANSIDRESATNGGYLGDQEANELPPAWSKAALSLEPGEVSPVVVAEGKFFLVGRMPRNFREDAEVRFDQAMEVRKAGKREESTAGLLEALKIYPRLLRALTYLGVSYAEAGNPRVGAGILNLAIRYYPQDAGAHFNLAVAEGALGQGDEIDEYQKALTIDPDYVPAYLNWGSALFSKQQYDDAAQIFRKGIQVNPLLASLHYNLSLTLERLNKTQEAENEKALALRLDPKTAEQR
jgi:predicted CXXCH cytochrome family protein